MQRELTRYEKIKIKVEKRLGWGWNAYRTKDVDPDLRLLIRVGVRHGNSSRGWVAFEVALGRFHFMVLELPKVD